VKSNLSKKTHITRLIKLIPVLAFLHLSACAQSSSPKPIGNQATGSQVISDSNLSFAEALGNQNIPDYIKADLSLVNLQYYSFDRKLHQGQLVIRKDLEGDIIAIFKELERNKFPIAKVIPISKYDFSDELSMLDNNSSAFNYRPIKGTSKLSNHALGRAIDINPFLNPLVRDGIVEPTGAGYDPQIPGTIVRDQIPVKAFKARGWKWGGDWNNLKDYQHFEKLESTVRDKRM
jgi:peptidoglycan L-alanyl-D-glutamate endopeptidase CwlK